MSESFASLDAVLLTLVDHRNQANDAAITAIPVPREEGKGAALAGHSIKVATDVLNAENAIAEQLVVNRFPLREILFPATAAGPFFIFRLKMRKDGAIAVRTDRGCKRVVVGLGVVTDNLDALVDHPVSGGRNKARTMRKVVAVFVLLMPAGVDDQDIILADCVATGFLQIICSDLLPLLFRNGDNQTGSEEVRKRHFVNKGRALNDVRRRINMGRHVHSGGDRLGKHARLRHVVLPLDLDILEIGPVWALETIAVREVVEFNPHIVVQIFLKIDAANCNRHRSFLPEFGVSRAHSIYVLLYDTTVSLYGQANSCITKLVRRLRKRYIVLKRTTDRSIWIHEMSAEEPKKSSQHQGVQVIARAAEILRVMKNDNSGLSLGQIAERVKLPRSTVQRIINALLAERLVMTTSAEGGLRLGPEIQTLAAAGRINVAELVRPVLADLARETGETVDLAVFRDDQMAFVDQVEGTHRLRTVSAVGEIFPMTTTANGKAALAIMPDELAAAVAARELRKLGEKARPLSDLVAEIEEIREKGLAMDLNEHTDGISAAGIAFEDSTGVVYAVSIPVPSYRFGGRKEQLCDLLKTAREHIVEII